MRTILAGLFELLGGALSTLSSIARRFEVSRTYVTTSEGLHKELAVPLFLFFIRVSLSVFLPTSHCFVRWFLTPSS